MRRTKQFDEKANLWTAGFERKPAVKNVTFCHFLHYLLNDLLIIYIIKHKMPTAYYLPMYSIHTLFKYVITLKATVFTGINLKEVLRQISI